MNIDQAIEDFDRNHSKKFSENDIRTIKEVAKGVGATSFETIPRNSGRRFIHDVSDLIRIQPSMIVFRRPFPGAQPRKTLSDPEWPYFIPLERWVDKGKKS